MSTTPFDKVMSGKSDEELQSIIQDKDGYLPEAREAAQRELKRREGPTDDIEELNQVVTRFDSDVEIPKKKENKDYIFYIPKGAPNSVKWTAYIYYVLLGIGILRYLYGVFANFQEHGFNLLSFVFNVVIYFILMMIIDGVLKGKNWARIANIVLSCLGLAFQALFISVAVTLNLGGEDYSVTILGVIESIIYVITGALLFVEPSNRWFTTYKDRMDDENVLDR